MGKKLIEVALPLEAINEASAREKSIRHGHPSTLHLWWARRPLAAARAVIFSQMVDDPSEYVDILLSDPSKKRAAARDLAKRHAAWSERKARYEEAVRGDGANVLEPGPEPTLEECAADIERERLFDIIRQLVKWENTTNETVLQAARNEIWQSWRRTCAQNADHPRAKELFDRHRLPAFHDPFAGGGALPLEAQRLGLQAHASDLNPVAALICSAMVEIPPKFAGCPPVNRAARSEKALLAREWRGAQGLAEDVRYYGEWMRQEADKRIGHLYPKVQITADTAQQRPDLRPLVGEKLTVVAWLWARTIPSPNPAVGGAHVPLISTFVLSSKPGKEAYVDPDIRGDNYYFNVRMGVPKELSRTKRGTKLSFGANFECILTGTPIPPRYVKEQALAGHLGQRLIAVVAEGPNGRVYVAPSTAQEQAAALAQPTWMPQEEISYDPYAGATSCVVYGLKKFGDLFTARQLVALTTLSDLVQEIRDLVRRDAVAAGLDASDKPLAAGGGGVTAYADSIATYLALLVDQVANHSSSVCGWNSTNTQMRSVFSRQAIQMVWDFAESNPFSESSGSFSNLHERQVKGFLTLGSTIHGSAQQSDVNSQVISVDKIVSTDPPYYDNIGYAELSDFFYVWLRRSLRSVLPDFFATLTTPKADELVVAPRRQGGKERAEEFFLSGMTRAMHRLAECAHPASPLTIYYAFKQTETGTADGRARTGWETFLEAVIKAGLEVTGTWPIRTEKEGRTVGIGTNALASSVVLVCRKRAANALPITRPQFVATLRKELPAALLHLQRGNIAPVDLAQAAIGPGMAVFTRYDKVIDAKGSPITVRDALALINQTLDDALAEQEGDFDAESRWALAWFEHAGFGEDDYGVADVLARAKNITVAGMVDAGVASSRGGRVRLLKPSELPARSDLHTNQQVTAWGAVHHLVRLLETEGEGAAAELVGELGAKAEAARELCYRLYSVCERKKRTTEALAYNSLVQSWPEITQLAREAAAPRDVQPALL